MDETQHFCLRWNNYQSSITSAFENLRDDEDFVDVTLACEGRSIKAHRVVLSACSPYFRDLLKSTPCKHPVILLQDVNFLDLHSLVEFIYHGEVNVHQKSLQSFLKTAEVLRVSGLTQQQAEETHSQLAQIHNLANTAAAAAAAIGRTSINSHHTSVHDEGPLYPRMQTGSPPPQQLPLASQHINSQLFKRSYQAAAMIRRNSSTPSGEDVANPMKRIRSTSATGIPTMGDNGLPSTNNNSPDMLHQQSNSPQLTPADFSSTMKNNNNHTPSFKDEKRNGPTGNGNGLTSGSEKLGSLTPSPLARSADDVKSEPMELVCSNNNQNSGACDEHSNDSTGENDANRSSSADGGKGSLSSGNDEEIENSLPSHPPPPFLTMSPADPKLFASAGFTFPMPIDSSALVAGFGSQLSTPADLGASPQGGSTSSLLGGVLVTGGGNSANSHDSHNNSNNNNNNNNNSNNDNNNLHQHHLHTMHLKHEQNQHSNDYTHQQQHLHQQQQQHEEEEEDRQQQQQQNDERQTPTNRPTPFDDDDKPGNITPASTTRSTPNHHQHQQLLSDKERERDRERDEDIKRLVVIPSPSHHQMRSLTPIPTSAHHQQQTAYGNALQRQHHQQTGLPLSMMASHHLHPTALHSPSANAHHHHHLARTASPLEHHTHPHHHLLHPRRSSLSPSPTGGRSSMLNSRGDVGSSASSRLLLPLPLNACHRCDVCGKLLSTKLTLKRHKEQQHLQPLNNAVCNLCHKVFRTLNSLNNHKSIYHRRQKTHHHHSYFHHANAGSGSSLGNAGSPSSRLHQSLSSLSNNGGNNGNAVAAAAVAAAAAAELLLSPIVGAAAGAGGQVSQAQLSAAAAAAAAHQQNSPNLVKPCMDFL